MKETLLQHAGKISELKAKLDTAHQEYSAYQKAFGVWLQEILGIADQNKEVHVSELLKLWSEKTNDTK